MKYSENDIDQFLGTLKKVPENVDINKVHQLLNQPVTATRLPETNSFNPLKIITMTLIIGIIIALTMYGPSKEAPKSVNPESSPSTKELNQNHTSPLKEGKERREEPVAQEQQVNQTPSPHRVDPKTKAEVKKQKTLTHARKGNFQPHLDTLIQEQPADCHWPSDTVIDGNSLKVNLTQEELMKLGFEFVEEEDKLYGMYYYNNDRGFISSLHKEQRREDESWLGESSGPMKNLQGRNRKKDPSTNDFFPLFETDFTHDPRYTPLLTGDNASLVRDTLVPVVIPAGLVKRAITETTTLWFKTSDNFFNALPERYAGLKEKMACVKNLRAATGRTNIVQYEGKQIVAASKALELSPEVLQKIGFTFSEKSIVFAQTEFDDCRVELKWTKDDMGVSLRTSNENSGANYRVIFVSNKRGQQGVSWRCGKDPDRNKSDNEYFFEKHDLLIPVVLKQQVYPLLRGDQYLWFEPTPEFLAIIPGEKGDQIRQEYAYIVSNDKTGLSSSCSFFQACSATLHLHDLNIFPNPGAGPITVTFSLPDQEEATISISDMNGRELLKLQEDKVLNKGQNFLQFNVSSLQSGMYLFVIHGKNGFITKRLLIQK